MRGGIGQGVRLGGWSRVGIRGRALVAMIAMEARLVSGG